jgi:hypothetical protein
MSGKAQAGCVLDREEYVEQAYFFELLHERLPQNMPLQDLLAQVADEVLVTTKLPLAIGFLRSELIHCGTMWQAMARLRHYFTPFQRYVMQEAEDERGRLDYLLALKILMAEARYRSQQPTRQGLFLYQFEALCRNRLRYDPGLAAMAEDPAYDEAWRQWILTVRRQAGLVELTDLIYVRSEAYSGPQAAGYVRLFGAKEGQIALANRHKDPLFFFAALQRQLDYPRVPRPDRRKDSLDLIPQMARRIERLEVRIKMLEEEQRLGAADLSRFLPERNSADGNRD